MLDALARLHGLIVDDPQGRIFAYTAMSSATRSLRLGNAAYLRGHVVFLGLESQVPSPHDYMTTFIGRTS